MELTNAFEGCAGKESTKFSEELGTHIEDPVVGKDVESPVFRNSIRKTTPELSRFDSYDTETVNDSPLRQSTIDSSVVQTCCTDPKSTCKTTNPCLLFPYLFARKRCGGQLKRNGKFWYIMYRG